MTTTRLNYAVSGEAWYARDNADLVDELRVGRDSYTADGHDDGCCWEFTIRLHHLGTSTALRVEMFNDSWIAYTEVPALFAALATMSTHAVGDNRQWTLADIVKVLNECGFTDDTPRTAP